MLLKKKSDFLSDKKLCSSENILFIHRNRWYVIFDLLRDDRIEKYLNKSININFEMLQVNIQFLVKNSLQIEYTPHQIPGFVFRQWTWKKIGSLEWRKSFIRVVCFSFISLLQKRRKIRHQGMKNLKSSNQGFRCIAGTTIKASSCSRHSLSWLPSS